jgi:N-acetylglucosamine-6-phosphate deacetylase
MLPAYVDIHCHGGGGTAFTDLRDAAAAAAAEHHHAHGSTSLLASLVTMSPRDLERGVAMLAELADDGVVDGIHLEGPWLAEARCGAHDPTLLRDPSLAEVERLIELGRGHIRQVTLAPERAHGLDLVRWLTSAGIHAAVGHTTATYGQVEAAVAAGADLATHLFNGMDPWHHRKPGAVAALMRSAARGHVTIELIADGAHLSDDTVRTVLDLVGADHVAFVSDAMAAAGVGDGAYVLGGLSVVVDRGIARLTRDPDGTTPGSIAGGTSHVADIVARAVAAGVPMAYAVRPATRTPARALGLADRGALAVGSRADVVVVDEAARATRVMRRGRWLESPLP